MLDCRFQLDTPSLVWNYRYLPLPIGIMVGGTRFPTPLILGKAMFFALANGILVDLMGRGAFNVPVWCALSYYPSQGALRPGHETNMPVWLITQGEMNRPMELTSSQPSA